MLLSLVLWSILRYVIIFRINTSFLSSLNIIVILVEFLSLLVLSLVVLIYSLGLEMLNWLLHSLVHILSNEIILIVLYKRILGNILLNYLLLSLWLVDKISVILLLLLNYLLHHILVWILIVLWEEVVVLKNVLRDRMKL